MKKYKSSIVADKLRKLLGDKESYARCKKIADTLNNIDPLADICRMIEGQVKKDSGRNIRDILKKRKGIKYICQPKA